MSTTVRALGVDIAGKVGWLGIVVDDSGYGSAHANRSLAALIAEAEPVDAIGVDVPMGDHPWGGRTVEAAARAVLGPRRSSIFSPIPPAVLELDDYALVNATLTEHGRPKISRQAWGLRWAMVDALIARADDDRIHEVCPETSFWAMNDRAPLADSKKSWNGLSHRARLLFEQGLQVPHDLGALGAVNADDVVDAAAVAWTALRLARGNAFTLPDPPELIDRRPHAVWI